MAGKHPHPSAAPCRASPRTETTTRALIERDETLVAPRVAVEYQLQEQDYLVLQSACENWDLAQGARKTLKKEGLTVEDVKQGVKAHPLVAVARDARAAFNRCLKQLNLQG